MSIPVATTRYYTAKECLALFQDGKSPEWAAPESRYELINGLVYRHPYPESQEHQEVIDRIMDAFETALDKDCELGEVQNLVAFSGLSDIPISRCSVVQPDVSLHRPLEVRVGHLKLSIVGAIEIATHTTALYDRREKLQIYEEAGIKDYWIVYLPQRYAEHYTLDADNRLMPNRVNENDPMVVMGVPVAERLGDVLPKPKTSPGVPGVTIDTPNGSFGRPPGGRDPRRIIPALNALQDAWEHCPDLRLGQLVVAAAGQQGDVFNIEDELLVEGLRQLLVREI